MSGNRYRRVALVGSNLLGNRLLRKLAEDEQLRAVDGFALFEAGQPDLVTKYDLDGLFTEPDIGAFRSDVYKKFLCNRSPSVEVKTYPRLQMMKSSH